VAFVVAAGGNPGDGVAVRAPDRGADAFLVRVDVVRPYDRREAGGIELAARLLPGVDEDQLAVDGLQRKGVAAQRFEQRRPEVSLGAQPQDHDRVA